MSSAIRANSSRIQPGNLLWEFHYNPSIFTCMNYIFNSFGNQLTRRMGPKAAENLQKQFCYLLLFRKIGKF